ncbi:RecT family recombinase [Streptomyces sp. G1]|uniref:recombinase RecT n=1 Tax=Streptomyces sp. G1 TaxID=361572 RepID=UPI00202FB586|nr:RecT family recombinase [Streptomyces sp. G1]MCM1964910.1 recombinase RecT [Streptomyces sp. G1]
MQNTAFRGRMREAMGKPPAASPAPAAGPQVDPDADNDAAKELTHRQQMHFLQRYSADFQEALPGCVDLSRFEAAVRSLVPTLGRCTTSSILQALLACARFGLVPDGREAVIVADGHKAVFVPMYQGYIDLMHRSGHVESVRSGFVYEGDEWNHEPSAPAPLDFTHKARPDLTEEERGEPLFAYAFVWYRGGGRSQVVTINKTEAEEIRDRHSRAYARAEETGNRDSTWHTDFRAMWRKSAIRRLPGSVPMSPEVRALVAVDEAGEAGRMQVLLAPEPAPKAEAAEAPVRAASGPSERGRAVDTARRRIGRKKQRGGPKGGPAA